MESKKLQQLQQANSHLAPQPMPHTKAPAFHPSTGDYRAPHSPVFQSNPQYHSLTSNFAQINLTGHQPGPTTHQQQRLLQHQLQQQHHLSQSPGSGTHHLHVKPMQINHGSNIRYPQQQQPATQSNQSYVYPAEQLYQNNQSQRMYPQASPRSTQPSTALPVGQSQQHTHNHPVSALQQQYQQLQQAKIQQQIQTQNEAVMQQQRTFALRQQLNPPVPQSHFHMQQSQSQMSSLLQHQQQPLRNPIPPSTLNLTSQFQPATGPMKLSQSEMQSIYGVTTAVGQQAASAQQSSKAHSQAIYQQNQLIQQQIIANKMQLRSPSEQTPIIQQNHPGLVVNQACQTQLSGTVLKSKSPEESPVHQPLDRKKSTGSTTHSLKSPVTKRPTTATVTLSGWLYKQGSEGLKVWRKRWFVLADYCLYYYKGPEEEKLLGSILLPSYRVAACSPDDKIYRKFAFKCEHQNMRTYWLAAETADTMGQWVRALTAATMMQGTSETSDQTSQPSVSSLNPSGENSDSGIHTYQSQQSKLSVLPTHGPVTPASDGGVTGGPQPLYANAPPKPRRANDGGYSSPSPENSIERLVGLHPSI